MAIADTRTRAVDARPVEHEQTQVPVVRARRPWLLGLITFIVAGATFVLVQDLLTLHNVSILRAAAASHRLGGLPSGILSVRTHLTEAALEAATLYLAFAGAGLVLAILGRRVLFVVPALTYVAYGFAIGPHQPQPIATQWSFSCASGCTAWYSAPWIGATVDLVLVLLPAAAIALTVRGSRWPGRLDTSAIAGIGVALGAMVVAYRTTDIVNGYALLAETIVVAAFALLAGTPKRWWPWAPVLFALVLSGSAQMLVWSAMYPDAGIAWRDLVQPAVPLVIVALLAGLWQPIAALLRRGRSRPRALLVAANLLNVADAGLTAIAVSAGEAKEINPVVTWMGLPAKLVLVAGFTWFLYRRQASALVWPVAALLLVLGYHLSGIVVNH